MANFEMNYLGLLANTDKSILKVQLPPGFNIEQMPKDQIVTLISKLEQVHRIGAEYLINGKYHCVADDFVYCIHSIFPIGSNPESEDWEQTMMEVDEFVHLDIEDYLEPAINLLRVYCESGLFMPLSYFYVEKGDELIYVEDVDIISLSHLSTKTHFDKFTIDDTDIDPLNQFINADTSQFPRPLELTLECFKSSYYTYNNDLAYLAIIMGLESLICDREDWDKRVFARRLSRLIGKTERERSNLYNEFINLYKQRSKIIHHQDEYHADRGVIIQARDYLRRAIKQFMVDGMNKQKIITNLEETG